jgi:hypothetical protein
VYLIVIFTTFILKLGKMQIKRRNFIKDTFASATGLAAASMFPAKSAEP